VKNTRSLGEAPVLWGDNQFETAGFTLFKIIIPILDKDGDYGNDKGVI
jgi:hypothetical protein